MSENEISKSKQKRLAQANARKEQKKKKAMSVLVWVVTFAVILGMVGAIWLIYQSRKLNYGKYLNNDGTIQAGSAAASIDYKAMSFLKSELLPSDATVQNEIDELLDSHKFISEKEDLTIADGDDVQITYDKSVGGVVTDSAGADNPLDITIGYGSLADEIDDMLIGHKTGDSVTVPVVETQEDEDGNEQETEAVYTVSVAGIYELPAFDDAFVQANFPGEASTAEEYRQNIINKHYEENLTTQIRDYIKNNMNVPVIPEKYAANLEKVYQKQNQDQFNYLNQQYYSYLGYYIYDNIYSMYGYETKEEYDEFVHNQAVEDSKYSLALQRIYLSEGMTNTADQVHNYFTGEGYEENSYQELVEQYGQKYVSHQALEARVLKHLCDTVTVTE